LQNRTAKSHCKIAQQSRIAKSHSKIALQNRIAKSHSKIAYPFPKGVEIYYYSSVCW
jgi:hypothetical protein